MKKRIIKTKDEARQFTIDWQAWKAKWQDYFIDLEEKFDLKEEF